MVMAVPQIKLKHTEANFLFYFFNLYIVAKTTFISISSTQKLTKYLINDILDRGIE